MKSNRILIIAFVCAASIISISCGSRGSNYAANRRIFVLSDTMMHHLRLDTAKTEPLRGVLFLTGKITADESKIKDVYPFVGGTVTSVETELGDFVHKNQVLAVIKSGEVADYDRQLIDARSDVAVAQKNLTIQQELLQSRLSSERDMISAKRDLAKAQADLQRIEEMYRIYSFSKNSEYLVKAPSDGYVIRKDIVTEMTLRADRASSIFTIADLNDVWVMADVYENDISKVALGVAAEITTVAYPDSIIYGSINKVYNILDELTRTMSVRIKLHNSGGSLKPGMAATISIRYQRQGTMTAIPSSCIVFDNGKNFVVIYKNNMNVQVREVQVAETVEELTYIKSGIQPGDVVVSQGQLFIYDALTD